jgi:hypothetical protein
VKIRSAQASGSATIGAGFRDILRTELARRCAANERYSLRAFARFLRTDHASLSQILRGKRKISETTVRQLSVRLGLDGRRIDELVVHERSALGGPSGIDLAAVREVTGRALGTLTNWHDWAILELTRLDCFRPDARWIARVLDCSVDDVQLALHRLTSFGFLEMTTKDRWTDRTGHVLESAEELASLAVERLAEELHELAVRAVRRRSPTEWTHSATTIAVDAASVPLAIRRLDQLRTELLATLEAAETRDAVYYLSLSFFPIADTYNQE